MYKDRRIPGQTAMTSSIYSRRYSLFCSLIIFTVFVIQTACSKPTKDKVIRRNHHRHHVSLLNDTSDSDDGGYGPWSKWYQCTTRCTQKRIRKCRDSELCMDKTKQTQTKDCDFGKCRNKRPASIRHGISRRLQDMVFNLLYNDWSDWSMCTRSCKQRRFRTCAMQNWCKNVLLMEEKKCLIAGTNCETLWKDEAEIDPEELDDIEEAMNSQKKKKKDPLPVTPKPALPPDPTTCGMRPASPSLRIVGGYEARKGSWPWQVAITTKKGDQYCGGVLVAPQWVLTAAHCVRKNGRRRRILVRAGEYDVMTTEDSEIELKVETDFPHPKFNIDTIDSDLAVVKLKTPVPASPDIQYACIPQVTDLLPPNTLCYAIGWGKLKETHRFGTDVLREAPVPLVNDEKCQSAFDYEITSSQMCAGYKRGGIDTCAGDSGGPLMCEIKHNGVTRWYVYGITSFGEGCGDKGKYGIYTKLTMFSDWIKNITTGG